MEEIDINVVITTKLITDKEQSY